MASSAVMMFISRSKLRAIVANLRASSIRSLDAANRKLPTFFQSLASPVSACNPSYIATERCSIRVVLREDRNCPTNPAACHVAPSVSAAFSSKTTSFSPRLAKW